MERWVGGCSTTVESLTVEWVLGDKISRGENRIPLKTDAFGSQTEVYLSYRPYFTLSYTVRRTLPKGRSSNVVLSMYMLSCICVSVYLFDVKEFNLVIIYKMAIQRYIMNASVCVCVCACWERNVINSKSFYLYKKIKFLSVVITLCNNFKKYFQITQETLFLSLLNRLKLLLNSAMCPDNSRTCCTEKIHRHYD